MRYGKEYFSILAWPEQSKHLSFKTLQERIDYRKRKSAYYAEIKALGLRGEYPTKAEAEQELPKYQEVADKYDIRLEVCVTTPVAF